MAYLKIWKKLFGLPKLLDLTPTMTINIVVHRYICIRSTEYIRVSLAFNFVDFFPVLIKFGTLTEAPPCTVLFSYSNWFWCCVTLIGVPSIGAWGGPAPHPQFFLKNLQTGPLSFLKICRRAPQFWKKFIFTVRSWLHLYNIICEDQSRLIWMNHEFKLLKLKYQKMSYILQ